MRAVILSLAAGLATASQAPTVEPAKAHPQAWHVERAMWKASGRPDTPKAYAEFLIARAGADADRVAIPALVAKLASPKFKERDEATTRLKAIGNAAVPALRKAVASKDAEAADLAKQILADITKGAEDHLIYAAVRLLRLSGSGDGVEGLLAYLPYAGDLEQEAEIMDALGALGGSPGKVHPALKAALASDVPERRSMAAGLVARFGTAEEQETAAKMLADPHPLVRLRVAQVIGGRGDDRVYRPLAGLLTTKPVSTIAWPAEEVLRWLADGTAPEELVWSGGESAVKAQQAWGRWLDARDKAPKPAKWERPHGRPMLMFDVGERHNCRVFGHDGVTRWEPLPRRELRPNDFERWLPVFRGGQPSGRQLLPGDRLLVLRETYRQAERPVGPGSERTRPVQVYEVNEYALDGSKVAGVEVESSRREIGACRWSNGRVTLFESDRVITTGTDGAITEEYRIDERLGLDDRSRDGTHRSARVLDVSDGLIQVEVETESSRKPKSYESQWLTLAGAVAWRETATGPAARRWDRPFRQGDGHALLRRNDSWEDVDPAGRRDATFSLSPVRRLGAGRYLLIDEKRNRLVEADGKGRVYFEIPRLHNEPVSIQTDVVPVFDLGWAGLGMSPADGPDIDRDLSVRLKQLRGPSLGRRKLALLALKAKPEILTPEAVPDLFEALSQGLAAPDGNKPGSRLGDLVTPAADLLVDPRAAAWPVLWEAAADGRASPLRLATAISLITHFRYKGRVPAGVDVWPVAERSVKDPSPLVRVRGLQLLRSFRHDRTADALRVTTSLFGDLTDSVLSGLPVGWWAVWCIDEWGADAVPALPDLIAATQKGDERIRTRALGALGWVGKAAPESWPKILPVLGRAFVGDAPDAVRSAAVYTLHYAGETAAPLVPDLVAELDRRPMQSQKVRSGCLHALRFIGKQSAPALPTLVRILETSKDKDEVGDTIMALQAIGPAAKDAIPLIEKSGNERAKEAIKVIRGETP